NEILPDKNYPNREELLLALLNKNFDFQRPFNTDLALPNKLEELNQLAFGNTVFKAFSQDAKKDKNIRKRYVSSHSTV
ncbi:hypothetical protein H8959_004328, partial [Pygathrix nigripes]